MQALYIGKRSSPRRNKKGANLRRTEKIENPILPPLFSLIIEVGNCSITISISRRIISLWK